MRRKVASIASILILGPALIAINLGGMAGCGSSVEGGSNSETSIDASKGATSAALSASSGTAAAGSDTAGLVVEALTTSPLAALKDATTIIPETTVPATIPCDAGSATASGTISGSVTTDDTSHEVTSLNIILGTSIDFDNCTPADIASTTDVDESNYTLDGTVTGGGTITGTPSSLSIDFVVGGTLTISGACSGTLALNATLSCTGSPDSLDCEATGSVTGTACGTAINCAVTGNSDNPTLSCD